MQPPGLNIYVSQSCTENVRTCREVRGGLHCLTVGSGWCWPAVQRGQERNDRGGNLGRATAGKVMANLAQKLNAGIGQDRRQLMGRADRDELSSGSATRAQHSNLTLLPPSGRARRTVASVGSTGAARGIGVVSTGRCGPCQPADQRQLTGRGCPYGPEVLPG